MREHYEYKPEGVCTKMITFDIEDGKIYGLHFLGGCPGNLAAISRLLEGAYAETTAGILRGNRCGHRHTSCADQLATAIDRAIIAGEERRKAS
ncbi:MAG: TIGR03905 family TSCPD domain-containing protein [Synergistaceae bacterium]|nr:TIGR03905 family TSCPD domain-containing protein [Synergistaceae bacterium]